MPDTPHSASPAPPAATLDQRARALFEVLAPLAPADRAPLITHAQITDPDACAEALDLLRYHDRDAEVIDSGALSAAAQLDPTLTRAAPPAHHHNDTLRPGTSLGGYLLQRPIGVGPIGAVYEALELSAPQTSTSHTVALKILRPDSGDPAHIRALSDSPLSVLNLLPLHPHLCRVHAVRIIDVDHQSRTIIVSDHCPGLNIVDHARAMSLPTSARLAHFADAFSALGALHGTGKAHARLRATNVVITTGSRCIVHDSALEAILASTAPMASIAETQHADVLALLGLLTESLLGKAPANPRDPLDASTLKALKRIDPRLASLDAHAPAAIIAAHLHTFAHEPPRSLLERITRRRSTN